MSRGKLRPTSEICADCSAPDATWASINRGVLVCDECCSVHRSLGRHVSQIKSVKKSKWNSTQYAMVLELVSHGANNIWEHSLLDPSTNKHGRRKANPRDPVHPTKADFIRAKYQFLAFATKQKEGETGSIEDLSKQLHSSVRTGNLETSLRLLSLGADANYVHVEKGNCPLHVAAQAGQVSQLELLVVYGGDPGAFDANGKTPVDYAKSEGHTDLADRIIECQYELTDRLAFYLCGRKPDHRAKQHFIIPEMADSSLDLSELAKAAKKKLQALPNNLFEELAMDVYDEVDRRENETIWLSTQNHSTLVTDRQTVPFLPVNPEFSSTRNQGRQKLARFNAREFATLIIDILSDARRRQLGISPSMSGILRDKDKPAFCKVTRPLVKTSSLSDDEPLYDIVASDEDYASIGDAQSLKEEDKKGKSLEEAKRDSSPTSMISFTESMASSDQSDGPITLEEYLDVKKALAESQARVTQLMQTNKDLKQEINLLQNMVQKLMNDNQVLRGPEGAPIVPNGHEVLPDTRVIRGNTRPQSMFEPRDPRRQPGSQWQKGGDKTDTQRLPPHLEHQGTGSAESDYDNANTQAQDSSSTRSSSRSESSQLTPTDSGHASHTSTLEGAVAAPVSPHGSDEFLLPSQDDVVKKTEKITKKIQELLLSAQEGKNDSYGPCADKISVAVSDMAALFPEKLGCEKVKMALQQLTSGSVRLREQCRIGAPTIGGQPDHRLKTQQVIQCAYDIAKAAKQLVTLFE